MKRLDLIYFLFISIGAYGQQNNTDGMRGPMNIQPGIIDGVVIKEEVPLRSAVPYEHVRLADYVWSKRVFSRIDAREKINHELFYPFDIFHDDYEIPSKKSDVYSDPMWVKHQERWSLWSIIYKHILLGDLTVYMPFDRDFIGDANLKKRDGYQFKYPILPKGELGDETFFDPNEDEYRESVIKAFSNMSKGIAYVYKTLEKESFRFNRTDQAFEDWWNDPQAETSNGRTLESIRALSDGDERENMENNKEAMSKAWAAVGVGKELREPDVIKPISSQGIVGYNIKEDWFFDKERSVLDKRIIAIAPVAEYIVKIADGKPTGQADEGTLVTIKADGTKSSKEETFQTEMFWLYFPDLRDVMVNYFTYNNESDAQWMSFDDLFWKRKFNAQIYRTSDKFDRNIEDYRFGVDALREAEKIKGEIRKWEHDVWNY